MPRQALSEYVDEFSRYGSGIAYVHRRGYRTERWSYRKIVEAARQFARELEVWEVSRGQRVLIWGDNCAEWVVAFWGSLLRGAVVVPMDRIATPDFALRVARQVEAKLLIHSAELRLPGLPSLTFEELPERLARHSREVYRRPAIARRDIAEIIFTSGTTAEPKGVVLTHGNLLANLEPLEAEIARYRKYEWIVHPLRFLNLLPLSHVFGQFMGLFVPPLIGGTVLFHDTMNPSEVVRAIKRERVSVLVTVPRLLEALKDKLERDLEMEGRLDWFRQQHAAAENERFLKRWWRFRRMHRGFGWKFWAFVSGGAALDAGTEAFWSRLGFAVIQGYGLTETASIVSLSHPFRLSKGSIGRSLPGREIKLDEHGEILVRGENIASAYWRGREMEPVAAEEGWFRTGDLGAFDEKGNLYFKGRKKNVIVTAAGMNVYPEDLEAALRRQPQVRDCVVVGVARNGEEEPCAVLILRPGAGGPEAILRAANQSLAEYQQVRLRLIWPGEDFPRTSTGKPRVAAIREAVESELRGQKAGRPEAAAAAGAASPLADLVARVTGRQIGALSPEAKLDSDLNLSSLDRVELLSALEDRYQMDLNEARFSAVGTVGELEQLLRQPPPALFPYPYPRWAQRWPVAVLRGILYYLLVWPATMLLAYPRIRGREHLRGVRGPVLVVANHVTAKDDVGFVLAALPARLRHRLAVAMIGERLRDLRRPPRELGLLRRAVDPIGYLLVAAVFNVFSMPKQSGVRASFQYAGESVDRGFSILVFPEGELTRDGRVGAFRSGIGALAKKLNVPVVPIKIEGLFELRQARKHFAWPGTVRVVIGPPARFGPETEPEEVAKQLQEIVADLAAEQ
jgi:long-chain acyl-CoA synthetase